MLAHFETVTNVTEAEILASVDKIPEKYETVENMTVTNSNVTCILRINQLRSESVEKCSVLKVFECSYGAVFKMCLLEFCFQNLPFSKYVCKKGAFFFRVNGRPIRHIFHLFQNVPASCEPCLISYLLLLIIGLSINDSPVSTDSLILYFISLQHGIFSS